LAAPVPFAKCIRKIEQGVYRGFSVGGKILARDPKNRKVITKVCLYEISLVDRPANPEATFDVWKLSGFEAIADIDANASALSKAFDALEVLKSQFAKMQTERDDSAFDEYAAAMAGRASRTPPMTKAEFIEDRRDAEARADLAKAAEADDLVHTLPYVRATTYGRIRTCR
jgi:uncharacterized short protein YbdD (DUF466 family)